MAGRESKFFYTDARLDTGLAAGLPVALQVNIPQDVNYMRAKIERIDWGIACEGERAHWVLWQGDDSLSGTGFETIDEVRQFNNTTNFSCFPLMGGISVGLGTSAQMEHFVLNPNSLYINDEQKVILCIDPTAGIGHLSAYVNILCVGVA